MRALIRATRVGALSILVGAFASTSCRTTPERVLDLADASGESEVAVAIETSVRLLEDARRSVAVRMAAAKTLGRIRRPAPQAVAALEAATIDPAREPSLRALAAWALGEIREPASLEALTRALRSHPDATTAAYLLDALAKHDAVTMQSQERLESVVEALVYFSGNHKSALPALYDVLTARTRTLPVNVRVLERSLDAYAAAQDDARFRAMYAATFELLQQLERHRHEIELAPEAWRARVDAAMRQIQRVFSAEELRTTLLAIWYLGRSPSPRAVGAPAANLLSASASTHARSSSASVRLMTIWALARLQLVTAGPRHVLLRDVLPVEASEAALALLADFSRRPEDYDQLQKIIAEVEEKEGTR